MSHVAQSFITTPRGISRVWCGVFLIGLPFLGLLGWILDPSALEWHVTGIARLVTLALLSVLGFASILAGIYYVFFERLVRLDPEGGCVTAEIQVWGMTIHRRAWNLSEFRHIEVRHRPHGDGPSDTFQTDIGIRHSSGFVLWLRGYWSSATSPSSDARAFTRELRDTTGILYDKKLAVLLSLSRGETGDTL